MKKDTKAVNETAKTTEKTYTNTTEKIEKAAKEAAADIKEKTAKATKTVKEANAKAKEKATKTGKAAAKSVKAAETKAEETVKAAGEAVKKAAPKKAVKETIYLQYMGKEINKDDIIAQVKKIWTEDMKRKASELKDITLYLKTDDNAAYYVINGTESGKIDL